MPWEVTLPAEEPVLGINFARSGMERKDWLALVAVNSDSWLLSVAFFFGARLNRKERYDSHHILVLLCICKPLRVCYFACSGISLSYLLYNI